MTPRNGVITGDSLQVLTSFAADSVDVVAGSPPYLRLRTYTDDPRELGQEATVAAWVENLRRISGEVKRVLKPGGSYWLVVGDSFSRHERYGARSKSLLGGPERLIVALIEDGWILRSHVCWTKTTPLPSPIKDRLTCTWEHVLHFVRCERYFYDLDRARVPLKTKNRRPRPAARRPLVGLGELAGTRIGLERMAQLGKAGHAAGRNPGDHWHLPPGRAVEGHTATFPESLIRRPLLLTAPEQVCTNCGRAWERSQGPVEEQDGAPVLRPLVPCGCAASTIPGLVLDPWAGSGTTLKVARELGLDATGIELSPRFAEVARRRSGFDRMEAAA